MAQSRKDLAALKSLAAVGIFALLVLGGTYAGTYTFCPATYDSTAIIQLPVGPKVAEPAARDYVNQQALGLTSDKRVLQAAWENLATHGQASASGIAAWQQATLPLVSVAPDVTGRTLAVRSRGNSAEGAAATANALAAAYVKTVGAVTPKGQPTPRIAAAAQPAVTPLRDNRRMIALSASSIVLFLALVSVMTMRQTIRRQLSAIDEMADREDLEAARQDLGMA